MEEIKLNMENLTKEEREQLLKLVEKANKENRVWKPNYGDIYLSVDSHSKVGLSVFQWVGDKKDELLYSLGLCFKTREEAEFALERQRVIVELERFAKEHNNPNLPKTVYLDCYKILEDSKGASFRYDVSAYRYDANLGVVSFSDTKTADDAIQAIGVDRIKKYYFGVSD